MNLTMATSSLFGSRDTGVLSVGRVQTPTLKLVVDRDREIENFKSKDYFELSAEFADQKQQSFWAKWEAPEDLTDEEGRCLNQNTIKAVGQKIQGRQGLVKEFKRQQKQTKPPLCFILSSLQKIASSKFGLSAKKTLEIAQSLYEKHKATTYPRTDCGYLPESQFAEAKGVLQTIAAVDPGLKSLVDQCDLSYRSSIWNDKKITAHHAIIPTMNKSVNLSVMSDIERKVYDLIRRYYVAQFLGDYKYSQSSIVVECEAEIFKATSNTPLIQGWKKALGNDQLDDNTNDTDFGVIPELNKNEQVDCTKAKEEAKQTKPPARFTEGSLITAMKSIAKYVEDSEFKKVLKDTAGIGTEATRANILETLLKREYLEAKGKQLISTKKGRALIDLLPDVVKNPATTAQWEQTLEDIAAGKSDLDGFLYDQKDVLDNMLGQLTQSKANYKGDLSGNRQTISCPNCGKPMYKRKGKKGYFWGCSGHPKCRSTFAYKNTMLQT
jgi:DNA topoisomerase-3